MRAPTIRGSSAKSVAAALSWSCVLVNDCDRPCPIEIDADRLGGVGIDESVGVMVRWVRAVGITHW
jgi:hypothetical protein